MADTSQITTYKCPNCSAGLPFNGGEGLMVCEYCGSEFDPEALRQAGEIFGAEQAEPEWNESQNEEWTDESKGLFRCDSCGAVTVADAVTAASFCPYCGNPAVLSSRLSGELRPDLVSPFCVEREAAEKALAAFCAKKPLLPKSFLAENRIKKLTGIYVPFWLFDSSVDADFAYNATRVRTSREGDWMVTRTSHFLLRRAGRAAFEKIPVDGSSKMPDRYMEAIEPYDYSKAVDFSSAYLSGYFADRYDISSESSKPRANERIRNSVEQLFNSTVIGYTTAIPRTRNVRNRSGQIRYALMPVWMLNTEYRGKTYTFAMNGQTGRFVGDLPVSAGRLCAWLFGLAGGITLIGTAVALLSQLL